MNTNAKLLPALIAALICLPLTSLAQPRINLDPPQLLFEGNDEVEVEEANIQISNTGNRNLLWITDLDIVNEPDQHGPRRDDAGELLGQFDGINAANVQCSPIAWDWDNERMWVTSVNPNRAVAYTHNDNYDDFEEVLRIDPGDCTDGAWADGFLFLPTFDTPNLNRFNAEGWNIGPIRTNFPIVGVAADVEEEWLFLMNGETHNIHVFPLNGRGEIGEQIGLIENHLQYHNNSETFGLEWVPRHHHGQLWMISPNNGEVHQIEVDTDNWSCIGEVQHFLVFPGREEAPASSVAHDGDNIWTGGFSSDNIRVYDDGIYESYWIRFDPKDGELEPGSDMDVTVALDPTGLLGGDYEADLHFLSNDPVTPDLAVNIRMVVIGAPDILVEWPIEAGYPDIIDFNRLGDVWVGRTYELDLECSNVGTEDLAVNDLWFESEFFNADTVEFVLSPGNRQIVTLTYRNADTGEVRDTLHIVSNDPRGEEILIPIRAEAFRPAIIVDDSGAPLLPNRLQLGAIHPNPFNSITFIEYSLPTRAKVRLSVLDLQGRELRQLSDGMLEAGHHTAAFDGNEMPAGCYLVKLQAGDEVKFSKALLIK